MSPALQSQVYTSAEETNPPYSICNWLGDGTSDYIPIGPWLSCIFHSYDSSLLFVVTRNSISSSTELLGQLSSKFTPRSYNNNHESPWSISTLEKTGFFNPFFLLLVSYKWNSDDDGKACVGDRKNPQPNNLLVQKMVPDTMVMSEMVRNTA